MNKKILTKVFDLRNLYNEEVWSLIENEEFSKHDAEQIANSNFNKFTAEDVLSDYTPYWNLNLKSNITHKGEGIFIVEIYSNNTNDIHILKKLEGELK